MILSGSSFVLSCSNSLLSCSDFQLPCSFYCPVQTVHFRIQSVYCRVQTFCYRVQNIYCCVHTFCCRLRTFNRWLQISTVVFGVYIVVFKMYAVGFKLISMVCLWKATAGPGMTLLWNSQPDAKIYISYKNAPRYSTKVFESRSVKSHPSNSPQ